MTGTGTPLSSVGVNTHWRTAARADSSSRGRLRRSLAGDGRVVRLHVLELLGFLDVSADPDGLGRRGRVGQAAHHASDHATGHAALDAAGHATFDTEVDAFVLDLFLDFSGGGERR